jgi:hypothetical protein
MSPPNASSPPTPESFPEGDAVMALLRRHGWVATSFQTLSPGLEYWFSAAGDAVVAYRSTGGSWVAAGSAVCAPERLESVLQEFADAARRHGRRAVLFAIEDRAIDAVAAPPPGAKHRFTWIKIGEQPAFDPRAWTLAGRPRQTVRAQVHRAANHGVKVREARPDEFRPGAPLRDMAEALIGEWRDQRRMSPMAFLVDLHPFREREARRYFVADRGGELVGLLACVPIFARNGWFAEDLIRRPSAPNGTAEALVSAALATFGAEGVEYLTLGLAALSGEPSPLDRRAPSGIRPWLPRIFQWSYRHTNFLYSYRGIRAFKEKFRPDRWEPLYLAVTPPSINPRVVIDMLSAFVPGSRLVFAADTAVRVARNVAQRIPGAWLIRVAWTFSLLLIPWIGLLLSVDARRHFGSTWLPWAWASFDVAMGGAFALLAVALARWRRFAWSLARVMLGAVLADVWLTGAQVLLFNLPRADGGMDVAVSLIAVAAPVSASLFLAVIALALRPRDPWRDDGLLSD